MLAQYIMDKGAIKATKESLIDVLEIRFGDIQKSLKEKIDNIDELAILKELLKKAVQIKSINELEVSC